MFADSLQPKSVPQTKLELKALFIVGNRRKRGTKLNVATKAETTTTERQTDRQAVQVREVALSLFLFSVVELIGFQLSTPFVLAPSS